MSSNITLTFDCLRFDGAPRFIYRNQDGELGILDVEIAYVNFSSDSESLCVLGDLKETICTELLEADSITIDSGGAIKTSLLELLKYVKNQMAVMTSIVCLASGNTVYSERCKVPRDVKLIADIFKPNQDVSEVISTVSEMRKFRKRLLSFQKFLDKRTTVEVVPLFGGDINLNQLKADLRELRDKYFNKF